MLSGNFYDIQSFSSPDAKDSAQQFTGIALLNPDHPIYQGHFPGNPVVPGVCQIQMVKELVEKAVDHPLRLTLSDNIKFLSMINPLENPRLEFRILLKPLSDRLFSATASIISRTTVFLKFKGEFEFE
jgi:3-hydroxyacyl-[acyl-carrier-protein] dehydratase